MTLIEKFLASGGQIKKCSTRPMKLSLQYNACAFSGSTVASKGRQKSVFKSAYVPQKVA